MAGNYSTQIDSFIVALNNMNLISAATMLITNAEVLMQLCWFLFVLFVMLDIVFCCIYAGLRAKDQSLLARCVLAIMSLPFSLIPLVYVKRGSGIVFGYNMLHHTTPIEANFQLARTDEKARILQSAV